MLRPMKSETVIRRAEFNPKVCQYWMLSGVMVLVLTLIGIPLLLIWLPLGLYFTRRYLDRMECVLTEKNLKVKKGMFVRVEKTIPLEKITDLGMVQGPIMRHFGIHKITIETAGQSSAGPLVSMDGIVDVEDFREEVLDQRDKLLRKDAPSPAETKPPVTGDDILIQIHQTLLRIEKSLGKE